jgi:hypothetical protein
MTRSSKQLAIALSFAAMLRSIECPGAGLILTGPGYANGQFYFTLNGESKAGYVVLSSGSLTNWTPILTNYDVA